MIGKLYVSFSGDKEKEKKGHLQPRHARARARVCIRGRVYVYNFVNSLLLTGEKVTALSQLAISSFNASPVAKQQKARSAPAPLDRCISERYYERALFISCIYNLVKTVENINVSL